MSKLILIIEDEEDLVTSLEYRLQQEGYRTRSALTGTQGLALAHKAPRPDLVLLDLMLPDIAGTEVCLRLKGEPATRTIPILMLTAKGEEIDRIVGFEVGADDYVVKPYSVRELVLRIRAILRRGEEASTPDHTRLVFGRLTLDEPGHRVWIDEAELMLTALEFKLLATFLRRRGRVQTRSVLLDDVWSYDADVTTRTVDTHVKRLREKLGPVGHYVETLRGVGYRFRSDPDESAP